MLHLFAKYVLGLPQVPVTELLPKPKLWDKLVEKGRDFYRQIHSWAAEEVSVLLLYSSTKIMCYKKRFRGDLKSKDGPEEMYFCELCFLN